MIGLHLSQTRVDVVGSREEAPTARQTSQAHLLTAKAGPLKFPWGGREQAGLSKLLAKPKRGSSASFLPLQKFPGLSSLQVPVPKVPAPKVPVPKIQERKISPKRKFSGRILRGHPGVIRADIPAQNFGQGPQNPGKTSIWARTSMTRRRGRPRPQGIFKNFGQKNFGLNFRSLKIPVPKVPGPQVPGPATKFNGHPAFQRWEVRSASVISSPECRNIFSVIHTNNF